MPRTANKLRVLVVEDDALIRLGLGAAVEECGHEVVGETDTGQGAIALAELKRPDLVLMDIRLAQGGDGVAAARLIRAELGIPSLFISGSVESRERAEAAAPLGFLAK